MKIRHFIMRFAIIWPIDLVGRQQCSLPAALSGRSSVCALSQPRTRRYLDRVGTHHDCDVGLAHMGRQSQRFANCGTFKINLGDDFVGCAIGRGTIMDQLSTC